MQNAHLTMLTHSLRLREKEVNYLREQLHLTQSEFHNYKIEIQNSKTEPKIKELQESKERIMDELMALHSKTETLNEFIQSQDLLIQQMNKEFKEKTELIQLKTKQILETPFFKQFNLEMNEDLDKVLFLAQIPRQNESTQTILDFVEKTQQTEISNQQKQTQSDFALWDSALEIKTENPTFLKFVKYPSNELPVFIQDCRIKELEQKLQLCEAMLNKLTLI